LATSTSFKILYGYSYANTLDLENYVTSFNGGLPAKKIKQTDRLTDGSNLSRTNFLGGYSAKLDIQFKGNDLADRKTLLKIIDLPYFIPKKLQRTQIIAGSNVVDEIECQIQLNDSEKYEKVYYKSTATIMILSEESFFKSATATTHSAVTLLPSFDIVNAGFRVYATYTFTLSADSSFIGLKTYEGFGFRLEHSFLTSDVIIVTLTKSSITVTLNGGLLSNAVTAGSLPFELQSGTNTLYYSGGNGTVTIVYYETSL